MRQCPRPHLRLSWQCNLCFLVVLLGTIHLYGFCVSLGFLLCYWIRYLHVLFVTFLGRLYIYRCFFSYWKQQSSYNLQSDTYITPYSFWQNSGHLHVWLQYTTSDCLLPRMYLFTRTKWDTTYNLPSRTSIYILHCLLQIQCTLRRRRNAKSSCLIQRSNVLLTHLGRTVCCTVTGGQHNTFPWWLHVHTVLLYHH